MYIGKERDRYLLKCMKEIKKDTLNELWMKRNYCGHKANSKNDEYGIFYEACIIRMLQLHKRRNRILSLEFLNAYEDAKRLGIRLPVRSNKIYRRLKKVNRFGNGVRA